MKQLNRTILTLLIATLAAISCSSEKSTKSGDNCTSTEGRLTSYVNVFTGTDGPGNTYPGATVPFGMVQLSPDNGIPGWDRIAGYFYPDSTIAGFSHTHLSGTGAGDLYDLLVMPTNSRFKESLTPEGAFRPYSKFSHDDEEAEPGYYSVMLKSFGIKAELTTTKRVGFHRYTFPEDSESSIILDLGYSLNWDKPVKTEITAIDNGRIEGYRWSKGWARDQRIFFVAELSRSADSFKLSEGGVDVDGATTSGKSSRIEFTFSTKEDEQILMKMALSNNSIEGARNNLAQELTGWDFDKQRQITSDVWEDQLASITIEGSKDQKEVFYTNMYHAHLAPTLYSDCDGKYGVAGTEWQAEGWDRYDTFSLWDTFRAAHPLFTLIAPDRVDDMVNSMLDHYKDHGELPVWSLAGKETFMMIGYHAVPVIVDAYLKGVEFDTELAFQACVESAMKDTRDIDIYKEIGYIPYQEGEKEHGNWDVSITLEYAYGDACIARFAKALGKDREFEIFSKRAENWRNLYDESKTFMVPRYRNGEFMKDFVAKDYHKSFCESNAWQYFWFVPQNIEGLIEITGGREPFTAKLDSMFNYYPTADDKLPIFSTGMIGQYAHGNEPSHHVAYLYNYVDEPWKTQSMVREILNTQYSSEPDGYCGNEDCGQMSAWMILSTTGLYPVDAAAAKYDITTPWVEKATIDLPKGKQFVITAPGVSDTNKYIKSIKLNGKPYTKWTIDHKDIVSGGTLEFELSSTPVK